MKVDIVFKNKKRTAIILILLFAFSMTVLMSKYPIDNYAYFGGDTWEYQSMGVNLSQGYGYRFGGLTTFETYHFDPRGLNPTYLPYFYGKSEAYNTPNVYRTPGYPLFLGFIYTLFGPNPYMAKFCQITLLAVMASFFPILSYYLWKPWGFVSGLAGLLLYLVFLTPDPSVIMGEALITFSLFIWAWLFLSWDKTRATSRLVVLGIFSGILVLIKGVSVFIPPLLVVYIFFFTNVSNKFGAIAVYTLCAILVVMPWSAYASLHSKKLVILSTQAKYIMLGGNNEGVIHTGAWDPHWTATYDDTKESTEAYKSAYMYRNMDMKNTSTFKALFLFYKKYFNQLPTLFFNKLKHALAPAHIRYCVMAMLLYYGLALWNNWKGRRRDFVIPVFPLIFFINSAVMTFLYVGEERFLIPFMYFLLLPAAYLPFLIFELFTNSASNRTN